MVGISPPPGWQVPNSNGSNALAQYHIYPNPGTKKSRIPYLVAVQNAHISSRTGATVVIPLRANAAPVEIMAPLIEAPGQGFFVLSADEIFAIDTIRLNTIRLKVPVGILNDTIYGAVR